MKKLILLVLLLGVFSIFFLYLTREKKPSFEKELTDMIEAIKTHNAQAREKFGNNIVVKNVKLSESLGGCAINGCADYEEIYSVMLSGDKAEGSCTIWLKEGPAPYYQVTCMTQAGEQFYIH